MTFADKRVLVVEDNFLVSLGTTDMLEAAGCVIVGPAASSMRALDLARSEALDAAILDIDIAGEAVWPIARELQRRNVPFVFLSAYHQRNGTPASFDGIPHLPKPLERIRLLDALRVIFAGAREAPAPC
jgi:CheY-like chemotaxis protein